MVATLLQGHAVAASSAEGSGGRRLPPPTEPAPVETRSYIVGLRSGFGLPAGRYAHEREVGGAAEKGEAIRGDVWGVATLWLEAGYELSPHWSVGAYGMFGLPIIRAASADDWRSGGCPHGADCFAWGWRAGLQVEYRFCPAAEVTPWLSLGSGYEAIHTSVDWEAWGTPIEFSNSYYGWELAHLQAGVDFALTSGLSLGGFASASLARYGGCDEELLGEDLDCRVVAPSFHSWLLAGAKTRWAF